MQGYELTPDGLLRHDGKEQDEVAPLDTPPPTLPSLVPELARLDEEAAQRFNKIAQMLPTTTLTAPPA